MPERAVLASEFLKASGWGMANRTHLAGDASDRRYERLRIGTATAVLMDAPPGQGDDPAKFVQIANHLLDLGLSAPKCYASDLPNGFLLLEDLGDGIYARSVLADPSKQHRLYRAATDVLARLQSHPPCLDLPDFLAMQWAQAAAFALDWYRFAITGTHVAHADFQGTLADLLQRFADGPRVMILRDYHAENLIWLPNRAGIARVGLLDFQLAQMGQPAYDLVSLLQDARRDVSPIVEKAMKARFAAITGSEGAIFDTGYAVLGAQRALRILGVFARLCLVAGKSAYLDMIPRVWGHLQRNLATPALAPLAKICAALLPEPTPQALAIIGSKCGHFR